MKVTWRNLIKDSQFTILNLVGYLPDWLVHINMGCGRICDTRNSIYHQLSIHKGGHCKPGKESEKGAE